MEDDIDNLEIADITIAQGWESKVPILLNNAKNYYRVEFDMSLPEDIFMHSKIEHEGLDSFDAVLGVDGYYVENKDSVYYFYLEPQTYESNDPGELCKFPLEVYANLAPGTYTGRVTNIFFKDVNGVEYHPADVTFKINVAKGNSDIYVSYSDHTLTFCYDSMRDIREGKTYPLNTDTITPGWIENGDSIYEVDFRRSFSYARPTTAYYWFMDCKGIRNISNLRYLNTSEVTNMEAMFYYCQYLQDIDLSHFDTRKVTNMNWMFFYTAVRELDLSSFDTSNVTEMRTMFAHCKNLQSLDLSNFDTRKVTTMRSLFLDCGDLDYVDLTSFDTSNVESMYEMFYGCDDLSSLEISHFDTSKVRDMDGMFYGCSNLKHLDVGNFNTSNVTNMNCMFYGCRELKQIDVSGFNTENVTNMNWMFYDTGVNELDVSHFNTSNVTEMRTMFGYCRDLERLDLSNFDTHNVTTMRSLFVDCQSLRDLNISSFDTGNVDNMYEMFYECFALPEIDLSHFNTSKVTNMEGMFYKCQNLTALDLSSFDFSNVTESKSFMSGCTNLRELSIPLSMKGIDDSACNQVGTTNTPCLMHAPSGFEFGVNTSGDYFQWKSGYFKLDLEGIPGIAAPDDNDSPAYDLKGVRAPRSMRGIYIRNGKKYVKK